MNEDNSLYIFLNRIGDVVVANILFIVCCIPLVTIGPALTALYHCMLRLVKGNNSGMAKTFLKAFRQNFRQSILSWMGIAAGGVLLFCNIRFLSQIDSVIGRSLLYLSGAIAVLLVIETFYLFPVIAAFANSMGKLLKNAFLFAFLHFPTTVCIAVVTLLPLYMTYRDLGLLPLYAFCWFFFGFGLTAYINSFFLYRIFKPYLDSDTSAASGCD